MRTAALSYGVGLLFGAGLILAGMTRPVNVISFLDLLNGWNPSLAFVMIGAIAVHFVAYRFVPRLPRPVFAARWGLPTRADIDLRLLVGAALFGAGWGLGGYCPGPAIVSAAAGAAPTILFVGSMLAGMGLFALWERWTQSRRASKELMLSGRTS